MRTRDPDVAHAQCSVTSGDAQRFVIARTDSGARVDQWLGFGGRPGRSGGSNQAGLGRKTAAASEGTFH